MKKRLIFLVSIIFVLIFSIIISEAKFNEVAKKDYPRTNVNIFKDTPVWELALAVKNENTKEIERIVKYKPKLLNYQEPKFGNTLLIWAVGMEKYNSAETLLKCGADPNIQSVRYDTYDEETALSVASQFSWVDRDANEDPKYVKLLLKYGANPNWSYIGAEHSTEPGTSILMNSIGYGIEKTKLLVEAGADVNHKTKSGETAAIIALRMKEIESAYYLIVEKRAIVSEPRYRYMCCEGQNPNDKFYPVDSLRRWWICDIGSEEYEIKMRIVEEFARQGVNYWETEIPEDVLERIKQIYPETWKEYIKKY